MKPVVSSWPVRAGELRTALDNSVVSSRIENTHDSIYVPDIMEFISSDEYLNRPRLYPRQATILKIMFLQDHLFTSYDLDVIGEWEESFRVTGNNGIVPGTLERIQTAKSEGRKWFRETIAAIGRRGGKGYIGALGGAYVIWNYFALSDPQEFYGIDRDKRLALLIFGGKKEQAKAQQWRDLVNVILGGPCFTPFISRSQTESLTLMTPKDFRKERERKDRGIKSDQDIATFEILPKESTMMAGRGPASFGMAFDEMAHVTGSTGTSAEDVYETATPSLDQFGRDGWIYAPSSPWQQTGKFYELYQQAQEMEDGKPVYPEKIMFQLTSWDPYKDWEIAHKLPRTKTAPSVFFMQLRGAVQAYDDQMKRLERANPETFKVERMSHFSTVQDAYLNPDRVDEIFLPWPTPTDSLQMQSAGRLNTTYIMHGDPSKSGANFGFAIAHTEPDPAGRNLRHVVFDYIHAWRPEDFPHNNYEVDYIQVEEEIKELIRKFAPAEVSFDQYNSVGTIQRLRAFARVAQLPRACQIFERTATATQNWNVAECFKTAIGMNLVHAPDHELARAEMKFLQSPRPGKVDHPDSGPVTTKDVSDCLMIVTHALIGDQMTAFVADTLAGLDVRPGQQGGFGTTYDRRSNPEDDNVFSKLSVGSGRPMHGAAPLGGTRGFRRGG